MEIIGNLLCFVSVILFFCVLFLILNREKVYWSVLEPATYTSSDTDCEAIFPEIKLFGNSPYVVQISNSKNGEVFVRLAFKSNHFKFMTSETYKNKKHAYEKAKELSEYLNCKLEDLRKSGIKDQKN